MKVTDDEKCISEIATLNWHFLTFGGGSWDYRRAAKKLGFEALYSNFFANIFVENDKTLRMNHKEFYQANIKLLESFERGYGYWLWKPYLIDHYLKKIPRGEGLLYLDSGCEFNINEVSSVRFSKYMELAKNKGSIAFSLGKNFYDPDFSELKWTKRATLEYLRVENDLLNQSQIQATAIFIVSCQNNFDFLKSWMDVCETEEYRYLLDSFEAESDNFIEHRHDQSIFSCLYKKTEKFRLENEIYFGPDWQKSGANFPIWGKRNRTGLRTRKQGINDIPDFFIKFMRISKQKFKIFFKV